MAQHTLHAPGHQSPASANQKIGMLMGFEVATLVVISFLHLSGNIHGGSKPYDPDQAGIAEAVIGVVLACGAAALLLAPARGRFVALSSVGFAILGFLVGLGFTVRGGTVPDVLYHTIMLPILLLTFVALVRAGQYRR
jgi:hypothetical protein